MALLCVALVAAIPAPYIGEILSLDTNSGHVYSFIIRENGPFVVRTGGVRHDNCFGRVRSRPLSQTEIGNRAPRSKG